MAEHTRSEAQQEWAATGGDPPVFVSSEAAEAVFSWREAVDALAGSYAAAAPPSALPPRTVGSDEGAWLRTLPALPPGRRYFGAKLMGMATAAADPGAEYVIVLFDRESSGIAAFVDGHRVTAYRTAATSAAALDRLAPPGPIRLAVLGSGLEAAMHVRAFAAVRAIERVAVFSPTPERREAFAAAAAADLGVAAEAVGDPEAAVGVAGVVLAAARSRGEAPILFGEWLAPATTVVSIGSTVPAQREIDVSVVAACDLIVCDAVEEVVEQTGDMLEAVRAGIDFRDRTFSLHQLLAGELDGRAAAAVQVRRRRPPRRGGGRGLAPQGTRGGCCHAVADPIREETLGGVYGRLRTRRGARVGARAADRMLGRHAPDVHRGPQAP